MASIKVPVFLLLSSLLVHASIAEIICDDLPTDSCAFAVASSGKRCLLETSADGDGEFQCRTSDVVVERMAGYIESDQCVTACGVDRNTVGISSDSFHDQQFTANLCAARCYQNCPNIVDLYFNLAAGEGVFLPYLCKAVRANPRRSMVEFLSSGGATPGSVSTDLTVAPASAPTPM